MNNKTASTELDESNLIKMFLLHQLDLGLREEVEEKFFLDPDFKEKILVAEEELLEDFVLKELSSQDQDRVKKYLLTSPRQMEKLRSVEEVIYSVQTFSHDLPDSEETSEIYLERIKSFFLFLSKPIVLTPLLLLICLAVGGIWLLRWQSRTSALNEELLKKIEILNHGNNSSENTSVFEIGSVLTRGSGNDANQILIKPSDKIIECNLIITQKQFKTYQVSLNQLNSDPLVTIKSLTLAEKKGAAVLNVKFPVEVFENGYYQIKVYGVTDDKTEEVESFLIEAIRQH